jgi:hypothetical protein
MNKKPPLSDFAKMLRKSYASSRGGTVSAERRNIIQSPALQVFAKPRAGQPLKGQEWRA